MVLASSINILCTLVKIQSGREISIHTLLQFCIRVGSIACCTNDSMGVSTGYISAATFRTNGSVKRYGCRYELFIWFAAFRDGIGNMLLLVSHYFGGRILRTDVSGCFKGNIEFIGTIHIFPFGTCLTFAFFDLIIWFCFDIPGISADTIGSIYTVYRSCGINWIKRIVASQG